MKLLHTTLLLAIIILAFSCKSQDQAMRDYYREVNKYTALENKLIENNGIHVASAPKQDVELTYNQSSEQAYLEQVKNKSDMYKVIYDDSEFANGDVYREAAKHRKALNERAGGTSTGCKDCPGTTTSVNNTTSSSTTATSTNVSGGQTKTSDSPDFFAHLLDASQKPIRKVGVTYVDDAGRTLLKQYSVIIAALSKKEGVDRLRKAFANTSEQVFFVKNEVGLFYAIIGSYDSESQAMEKLRRVEMEYGSTYTAEQLRNKYGITFSDLWILKK